MLRHRPTLAALCLAFTTPAFAGPPVPLPLACKGAPSAQATVPRADPKSREAAHKGLTFLAKASRAWTATNKCFGCHVQAVTLEALTVGKSRQYDVDPKDVEAMVQALKLGVTAGGRVTGVAFEGSAWARYDQWISERERGELLKYASELTTLQAADGSIPDDDARRPVTGGTLQTTFQAAQTWRQAFARTANDKWLPPLRRAEGFLSAQSKRFLSAGKGADLQDMNFALLGLLASGVGRGEASAQQLAQQLLARQLPDGGWSLSVDGRSDAFATGQTLYALKTMGYGDEERAIAQGLKYLVGAQSSSGAWSTYRSGQGGAEKAETMWAVLALVTVDVASVAVRGVIDGQHVEPSMPLSVEAADNQSGGVARLVLKVDDVQVHEVCGATTAFTWDTRALPAGKHVLDVIAINGKGNSSRRRFEVYAGDVFVTQLGAQFDEAKQHSVVSVRNIAPAAQKGALGLEIWSVGDGADAVPKTKVFGAALPSQEGAQSFTWKGEGLDGKVLPRGRYLAKVKFTDAAGAVRQRESTLFFHDSEAAQAEKFGEVEGAISLKAGGTSANTLIELVDERGAVVQQTRTTEQGNYRFKNVNGGKYRVRARKDGYGFAEGEVQAAPKSAPAAASLSL
jgi:Carboxypeptidase regulatory-like domain/Bacterial Ig domain/Squalene-hopene cyclase N-terminal domain